MYVNVDLLKKHLNIDPEFTDDDEYLEILEGVAEKTIQRHICCVLSDMEDGGGNIPSPLRHAIMLYVGLLYNSRESVSYGGTPVEVPYTYDYLINLYKNYSDTTSDDFINGVLDDLAQATMLMDKESDRHFTNVVIDTDLKRKVVDRIAQGTRIDDDGNYITGNIERI